MDIVKPKSLCWIWKNSLPPMPDRLCGGNPMRRAYLTEDNTARQSRLERGGEEERKGGYLLVTAYELLGPASPEAKSYSRDSRGLGRSCRGKSRGSESIVPARKANHGCECQQAQHWRPEEDGSLWEPSGQSANRPKQEASHSMRDPVSWELEQ